MIITSQNHGDCLLFNPQSTGKAGWEVLGLFLILYQSILIPYRLCFNQEASGGWIPFEASIDICFILDIFVQFNTGFYKKGNLINSRKSIIWNYLTTWFFIDLVASFPYNYLGGDISEQDEEMDDVALKTP